MAESSGKGIVVEGQIILLSKELVKDLDERGYGELKEGKLYLSPAEGLYLAEKEKISVENSEKQLWGFKELMQYFTQRDPEFPDKYSVYKNLRERGYIVRTGFKFGSHYRVYERGVKVGEGHAIWLVHVIPETHVFTLQDLSRSIRLAQNVRKKMIYAVVDKENDVTYYKMERIKP